MTGSDVVVVGAGIAGVAVTHRLSTTHNLAVTLVDPRPPLTLTSDKSTECYRNWWPNRPMVGLMNRSIDLLEEMADETDNVFGLTRRGYLFVTARPETLAQWQEQAVLTSKYGGGEVRTHHHPGGYTPPPPHGYRGGADGVDIVVGRDTVREPFPFLSDDIVAGLHVRRAGWFSAQQLGAWMLETAGGAGMTRVVDEVAEVTVDGDRLTGVRLASGSRIECDRVVIAAGPMAAGVAASAGLRLPLRSETHLKVAFRDHRQVVPRTAPMLIWSDPQHLDWAPEETEELSAAGRADLLGEMPRFCHGRPEGGADSTYFLALWEYHGEVAEPVWPIPGDDLYPEVVARGLTRMIPGFAEYRYGLPAHQVDGGYYTKTPENRPLIGPAGPDGLHLACGYSGFGVMVASGAADLVADHITGGDLPDYAEAFLLSRYDDPDYLASLDAGADTGQL